MQEYIADGLPPDWRGKSATDVRIKYDYFDKERHHHYRYGYV